MHVQSTKNTVGKKAPIKNTFVKYRMNGLWPAVGHLNKINK